MLKSIAIAAAVFVLGLAASAPRAAEMTPGATLGAAAAVEADSAREEAAAPSGPHAVAPSGSARAHLHPDSTNEAREASARSAVGGDAGGSADIAPKSRHRGGAWQALLPGVMK